ncbi:PfkB family carbohydrate kinase [Chelativorans sp.]|uniref:PfkB family carbohydrate kinase n=1 Tax=Chelativorans sp. TaxID=2203393 RepID=UPI002811EDE3|nr:PfkB family carbohydrate kinase [Chelativorans sp.]
MCLGGMTLDRVFLVETLPSGPSKTIAHDFIERGGGMAATAAVAVAALGGAVRLLSRVGEDLAGQALVTELERIGVDTRGVLRVQGGRTSTSAVHIDSAGERMLTNFPGDLPRDADWLPLSDVAAQSAVLADIRWLEGAEALLDAARRCRVPSVLDADAGDPASLRRLCARANHAVFSEQGLRQLSGSDDPETGLRKVLADAEQVIGVTLGDRGSLWVAGGDLFHVPALKVEAINSNGVGDVFHGAYTLAIGEGATVREAARFATLAAAVKCRDIRGWNGMPSRADIEELQAARAGVDWASP